MKVFAISDLHLSGSQNKPMDIFGDRWKDYTNVLRENWKQVVSEEDIVVIAGDISWAMQLNDAKVDLEWIDSLAGNKVILRGNHDYWWNSLTKVRSAAGSMRVLQNDAYKIGDYIFCGSRGWILPSNKSFKSDDEKIYNRELLRLKLSLDSAKRLQGNNEKIIVAMHFPPLDVSPDKNFEELFIRYGVDTVLYGHIHGIKLENPLRIVNGINYYITSCDVLNFMPLRIM